MAINSRFREFQESESDIERIRQTEQLDQTISALLDARNALADEDTSQPTRFNDPINVDGTGGTGIGGSGGGDDPPLSGDQLLDNINNGGGSNNGGSQGRQASKVVFKEFDFNRDVISVQRTGEEELFYPNKAVAKPFSVSEGYTTSSVDPESGYEQYNSTVYYLDKTNSDTTYLSTMRGVSGSYAVSSGSGMTYRYLVQLTNPNQQESKYQINDGINTASTSDELEVISVAREFYKDGIDPEFFGLTIDVSSGSINQETDYGDVLDNATDGLVGLFPYSEEFVTDIGSKYYLYRYASGTYYTKSTDTFSMPDASSLDTSAGPLGAVYTDGGFVVLFLDKIKALYGDFSERTNAFDYVASVGGNSEVFLNSTIYYARLENNEFNYTNNRTFYEDDNPNVIKQKFRNNPKTFPTIVGFYNRKNELVAIGKISKPFEKNGQEEALIRAELSY